MTTPLTPKDVKSIQCKIAELDIPKIINDLIILNWSMNKAIIGISEIEAMIKHKLFCSNSFIPTSIYVDVITLFENNGWEITYDRLHHTYTFKDSND